MKKASHSCGAFQTPAGQLGLGAKHSKPSLQSPSFVFLTRAAGSAAVPTAS